MSVYDLFRDLAAEATRPELAWMDRALCAEIGDDALWFPEKGAATRPAKRVCMACDVRIECLEYAIDRNERFGVWGGKSELERRKIKRERDRSAA